PWGERGHFTPWFPEGRRTVRVPARAMLRPSPDHAALGRGATLPCRASEMAPYSILRRCLRSKFPPPELRAGRAAGGDVGSGGGGADAASEDGAGSAGCADDGDVEDGGASASGEASSLAARSSAAARSEENSKSASSLLIRKTSRTIGSTLQKMI